MNLVQDDMTIAEYEKKFTKLSKYALAFVIDETDKCKRFKDGLRTKIWAPTTISANWSNFSKIVESAMWVKRCLVEEDKSLGGKKLSTSMGIGEEEEKSIEGSRKQAKSNFS